MPGRNRVLARECQLLIKCHLSEVLGVLWILPGTATLLSVKEKSLKAAYQTKENKKKPQKKNIEMIKINIAKEHAVPVEA